MSPVPAPDPPSGTKLRARHIQDLHVRVVAAVSGELLRELTIDTSRDYQPQQIKK